MRGSARGPTRSYHAPVALDGVCSPAQRPPMCFPEFRSTLRGAGRFRADSRMVERLGEVWLIDCLSKRRTQTSQMRSLRFVILSDDFSVPLLVIWTLRCWHLPLALLRVRSWLSVLKLLQLRLLRNQLRLRNELLLWSSALSSVLWTGWPAFCCQTACVPAIGCCDGMAYPGAVFCGARK